LNEREERTRYVSARRRGRRENCLAPCRRTRALYLYPVEHRHRDGGSSLRRHASKPETHTHKKKERVVLRCITTVARVSTFGISWRRKVTSVTGLPIEKFEGASRARVVGGPYWAYNLPATDPSSGKMILARGVVVQLEAVKMLTGQLNTSSIHVEKPSSRRV
jgi:hypothetical protein